MTSELTFVIFSMLIAASIVQFDIKCMHQIKNKSEEMDILITYTQEGKKLSLDPLYV